MSPHKTSSVSDFPGSHLGHPKLKTSFLFPTWLFPRFLPVSSPFDCCSRCSDKSLHLLRPPCHHLDAYTVAFRFFLNCGSLSQTAPSEETQDLKLPRPRDSGSRLGCRNLYAHIFPGDPDGPPVLGLIGEFLDAAGSQQRVVNNRIAEQGSTHADLNLISLFNLGYRYETLLPPGMTDVTWNYSLTIKADFI